MYSSKSVPDSTSSPVNRVSSLSPDYYGLVRFLMEPFLEEPASLKVDCEVLPTNRLVWIRLAFEGADKGRVFGRGGRNIQAIRSVLEATAQTVGQLVSLDIYGGQPSSRESLPPPQAPAPKSRTLPSPPRPSNSPRLRSQ